MTTENIIPEVPVETRAGSGCLGQVGWLLSGAILPMGSLSYYRKAAQKSVGSAVLFFVLFTLVISTFSTISLAVGAFSAISSIQEAFDDGDFPEIVISDGIAEVSGPQPLIIADGTDSSGQSTFAAIDTTGEITEIEQGYSQGFLLTRTEFHVVNAQNGYQTVPLSEINAMFEKDPIIINAQTTSQAWAFVSTIVVILAFIFLVAWHTVVRLMIIAIIALILWGIVVLIKPNTGFGPIIITGLYAIVPAIYLSHLLSRSNMTFPGLQTFFLLIFWTIGLIASFADIKFITDERPQQLWTALIGLPMLLLFIVDIFWQFPAPYDVAALWGVSLLTGLALIAVRLFLHFKDRKPAEPAAS
ncbi:MAG: DUF1189 family protein [Anaerolineales bacterium]|nr:DUF1189 family protein [Anaerolineales bacterium]